MRADLIVNYNTAAADAAARGVVAQLSELETSLQKTVATLNVNPKILRNMALSQNYMSYYKARDSGLRKIAERQYHAHRGAVDEKVHPGYRADILNAALSPDGRGLINYGAVTLELQDIAIRDRASVMRENAFNFYERYNLGRKDAQEAPGWRSTWSDRARLGVAHLEPAITTAIARNDIAKLILFSGPNRDDDRYMEVQIFGELSWQSLSKVSLEKPLTDSNERDDWDFACHKLRNLSIRVADLTYP